MLNVFSLRLRGELEGWGKSKILHVRYSEPLQADIKYTDPTLYLFEEAFFA